MIKIGKKNRIIASSIAIVISIVAYNVSSKDKNHHINNLNNSINTSLSKDNIIPDPYYSEDYLNHHLKIINSAKTKDKKNFIIKPGDTGSSVELIQNHLKRLGYPIIVDGQYGQKTTKYIMEFQFKAGLVVDGIVGKDTFEKLKNAKEDKLKYHKPEVKNNDSSKRKTPKESSKKSTNKNNIIDINNQCFCSTTPYFIYVDLKSHKVNIFSGQCKNWKLIKSFTCTTGAPSTPTIKGTYKLSLKGKELKLDYCVVKYYSQIQGNYLFHSILYDFNGKVMDSRLGYSLSHGCIRLSTENAKYIYDFVPIGTTIHIQ
ncbi:L,D-transpeptidase family protein [Haloimpatiens massiliensis]|uniref:L,D-transpeptidase family protein n=1 Tax=Haloimpatiens massiliensis TaxID=1658110 RepID=UPI000C84530F|nr:L,D-transpeptidase family protein [Haloimpatiens massiliensis]